MNKIDINIERLKKIIETEVFLRYTQENNEVNEDSERWIFDFRKVLMRGDVSNLISDIFYEDYRDQYPFQLCALEVAGIPLVTSLMTKFFYRGKEDINAFFIRKSRKKTGLLNMIEGTVQEEKKIILVDDITNSGNSFLRQIEVLEDLGYRIDTVWTILRFRDVDFYKRFTHRGIKVESLFTLNDFTDVLGSDVKNILDIDAIPPVAPFVSEWVFKSTNPSLNHVISKSQPVLDDTKIYFGTDNRVFWAINQKDGSVVWKYNAGPQIQKKSIFSSPLLFEDMVIFGSYDGNIYALDRTTGKKKWVSFEADWVGSSPAIAKDLGLVFIGLEFGLIGKRGGIIALDARTGKKKWLDKYLGCTHSSPLYIEKHSQVVIGANDGVARLYDAQTGRKFWEFTTFGGAQRGKNEDYIFGEGDIKEGFAYSESHDYIVFGSIDSFLYILDRKTGHLVHHFKCESAIFSTPYIYEDRVYFTSTDKYIRCFDLSTFKILFEKNVDGTRIFSTPTVIHDRLYVGTNAARLHELDPETGEELGYFQALERITNTVVYNEVTDTYFLPTYANEIIQLKRKK